MKNLLFIAASLLLASWPCQARIGETVRQAESRYGTTTNWTQSGWLLLKTYRYQKWSVSVVYKGGYSICEELTPLKAEDEFTEDECDTLVKTLSGHDRFVDWDPLTGRKTFWATDGGIHARLWRSEKKPDMLQVYSADWTQHLEALNNAKLKSIADAFSKPK
jgi:hypothetical protein